MTEKILCELDGTQMISTSVIDGDSVLYYCLVCYFELWVSE